MNFYKHGYFKIATHVVVRNDTVICVVCSKWRSPKRALDTTLPCPDTSEKHSWFSLSCLPPISECKNACKFFFKPICYWNNCFCFIFFWKFKIDRDAFKYIYILLLFFCDFWEWALKHLCQTKHRRQPRGTPSHPAASPRTPKRASLSDIAAVLSSQAAARLSL